MILALHLKKYGSITQLAGPYNRSTIGCSDNHSLKAITDVILKNIKSGITKSFAFEECIKCLGETNGNKLVGEMLFPYLIELSIKSGYVAIKNATILITLEDF